jgi:RNA polymerase sigma-70 factor (ECF subfamily)
MGLHDQTDMGGTAEAFLTTHWSMIGDIKSSAQRNRALIGLLLERYWKPVYFYIRRKGYDNEEAKDLTQGFFHEIVLNRKLVQRADQAKGRFRSFLLHALSQYLIDQMHKQCANKRIPNERLVSLDMIDPSSLPATISASSPEDSYYYGWMSTLLDHVLSRVEVKCREQGLDTHWHVFYDRVVHPILADARAPSLAEVCAQYHIANKKTASNMIITVKRCFQAFLIECVRNTVTSEDDIQEELEEIMRFFPKGAQHLP